MVEIEYKKKNNYYRWVFIAILIFLGVMIYSNWGVAQSISGTNNIGVLDLSGTILESREWIEDFDDFYNNDRIAAILIAVNSPGGSVAPSQEIYQRLKHARLEKRKPIIVTFGSIAASGGYYAALGADFIFSNPGSLTGSIGVIFSTPDASELMEKLGVGMNVIKSGELKDGGSPYKKMTNNERQVLQSVIDDVYDQFVIAVSEERKIDKDSVMKLADGRVFSGRQAYAWNLVDSIGTFLDAKDYACDKASISKDATLVYPKEETVPLWKTLLKNTSYLRQKLGTESLAPLQYKMP
jgi:protease IV